MDKGLVWRSDWDTKIPVLDSQHHDLFEHLNRIASETGNTVDQADSQDHCQQLLETFLDKIREHFLTEEKLMEDIDYPQITEHHREHAMLAAELQQVIREVSQGTETCNNVLHEIRDWCISHVAMDSQEFSQYYHNLPSVMEPESQGSKQKA